MMKIILIILKNACGGDLGIKYGSYKKISGAHLNWLRSRCLFMD